MNKIKSSTTICRECKNLEQKISGVYIVFLPTANVNIKTTIGRGSKCMNRICKWETQMASKYKKNRSTSLVIT